MEAPHERFHLHGVGAIKNFLAGQFAEGFEAIDRMEAASLEVLTSLDRIASAGEKDRQAVHSA
jgi:hypothetical protein